MSVKTSDLQYILSANIFPNDTRQISANSLTEVFDEVIHVIDSTNTEFVLNTTVTALRANTSLLLQCAVVTDSTTFSIFKRVANTGRADDGVSCIKDLNNNEFIRVTQSVAAGGASLDVSNIRGGTTLSLHNISARGNNTSINYAIAISTTTTKISGPAQVELAANDVTKLTVNSTGVLTSKLIINNTIDNGDIFQVTGISFFNGGVRLGGSIEPTAGNAFTLGSIEKSMQAIFTTQVFTANYRAVDSTGLTFRNLSGNTTMYGNNNGSWLIGSGVSSEAILNVMQTKNGTSGFARMALFSGILVATANNDLLATLDLGSTYIPGPYSGVRQASIRINNDIISTASGISSIGSADTNFANVFVRNIESDNALFLKGTNSWGIKFGFSNNSNEFARFAPNTGNLILQDYGVAPADTGERLQVKGNVKITGTLSVNGFGFRDRFISTTAGILDANLATNGGVYTFGNTTTFGSPGNLTQTMGYGTIFTTVGASNDGDSNVNYSGSYANQFVWTTSNDLYFRQRVYTYGDWTALNKFITTKDFAVANVAQLNIANNFISNTQFTSNWNGTTGQVRLGKSGQAGIMSVMSGNGSTQTFVGYLSATSTDFELRSTTATGTMSLGVGSNTVLKIFNNQNVVLGTGSTSAYVDSGQKLQVLGTAKFTDTITVEGAWSATTGQLKIGNSTNAGLITLAGAGGVSQGYVGYLGATNANFVIGNYTSGGSVGFDTSVNTVMKLFNDGSVVLQTGLNTAITSSGEKLQVIGTSKFTGDSIFGAGFTLSGIPTYADNAAATAGGLAVNKVYKTSTGVLMIKY